MGIFEVIWKALTTENATLVSVFLVPLSFKDPITKEWLEFKCLPKKDGTWSILNDIEIQ